MSTYLRAAALVALIAIAGHPLAAGGPGQLTNRPNTEQQTVTPPVPDSASGVEPSPWSQLSGWPSEMIVPWNDDVAASFENGRGLWLNESGEWDALTPSNPYALLVVCDTLFAAFPDGGGLWSYDRVDGWENLSLAEPVRLIDAGPKLLVDFGELGLWEYDCGGSPPVSLRLDDLESPFTTGEVIGSGTCSGNPNILCTRELDCSSAEPPAGTCENVPCERTIRDWSADLSNVPLTSLGGTSPTGDIILDRVRLTYDPAPSGIESQIVGLGGVTIPPSSSAIATFAPISLQALEQIPVDQSTSVDVTLVFEGRTPADLSIQTSPVTQSLFIEKCAGAN